MTRLGSMPQGRGDDHLRRGVDDPRRHLARREAAEHDRMDRADPRAGQHGDDRFRDQRHIDQHPVALADAKRGQPAGEARHLVQHLGIGQLADRPGQGTIVDEGELRAAPIADMAVQRVPAGIGLGPREPLPAAVGIFRQDGIPGVCSTRPRPPPRPRTPPVPTGIADAVFDSGPSRFSPRCSARLSETQGIV